MTLICKNLSLLHPRMLCTKFSRNWPSGSREWRGFFKFCESIIIFSLSFRLEKVVAIHLTNLNPLHPRMLCAKFRWNWSCHSGVNFSMLLKYLIMFYVFFIHYPLNLTRGPWVTARKQFKSIKTYGYIIT